MVSVWPTCVMPPSAADSSAPEFRVMTGMRARTALCTALRMASGLGADTARPSTPSVTAASMSCACSSGSLFDSLYLSSTPMSLAPSSAPFFATDQKDPPSPWVTIAMVRSRFCVTSTASSPPPPPPFDSESSPPQPAAKAAAASVNASTSPEINKRLIVPIPLLHSMEPARSRRFPPAAPPR
jgi:hypothetical protein